MLCIEVGGESFDESKEEFVYLKPQIIKLEHSLISMSKWESQYHIPFLKTDLTPEQLIDYIKCMTISRDVDPKVYDYLSEKNISDIENYIDDSMTATTFNNRIGTTSSNREIITSEIIYYWMVEFRIPLECEKWHLNRLLTLINVINIKNSPQKKMSPQEIMAQNKALNEARRKASHSKG